MIAALDPRRHMHARRLGDDVGDPGSGTITVDNPDDGFIPYNPTTDPLESDPNPNPISSPIILTPESGAIPPPPPGWVSLPDGTLVPVGEVTPDMPVSTTNEPVIEGGLQFPVGTTGIDDSGQPVNSQGQVLSPTGAVLPNTNPIGIVTPIAQAATKIAQLAASQVAGSSLPTLYPAPAGATLPPGAVGVNAAGQPVNAQGQILSATPLTGSWFSSSTAIAGMNIPNVALIGGIGLIALLALSGSKSSGKRR